MRLFFILGVIFNHTVNTVLAAMNGQDTASETLKSIRLMFHYSRNGFLFMNGLVLTLNYFHRHDWGRFYRKRFSGSLWPYLLWNLFFLVLFTEIDDGFTTMNLFSTQYLAIIIHGNRFYMYYMLLVMQLYLIFPGIVWLFKRWPEQHRRILGISLFIQLTLDALIKYWLQNLDLSAYPYWFKACSINIFSYQFYFISGAFVCLHYQAVTDFIHRHIKWLASLACCLSVGTIFYMHWNMTVLGLSYDRATSPHQPYMQVFDILMIMTIFWIGQRYATWRQAGMSTAIEWLVKNGAKISFGMYLNQSLGLLVLKLILKNQRWQDWQYLLMLPLGYIGVIGSSFAIAWFCYKVPPFGVLIGRPQWHFRWAPLATKSD